jgi:hypothetical protein
MKKKINNNVKNKIFREILKELKLPNIKELALLAKIPYTSIIQWEKNNRIANPDRLIKALPMINPAFIISQQLPVLKPKPKNYEPIPESRSTMVREDIVKYTRLPKSNFKMINQILERIMSHYGLVNLQQLSDMTGIGNTTLQMWNKENDIKDPRKLSLALPEINPLYILYGTGDLLPVNNTEKLEL